MNPKRASELDGVRLAFAQGGDQGFKLVFVTPPVIIKRHGGFCEATWPPAMSKLLKYSHAPLLINNDGKTEFPLLKKEISKICRHTWAGRFSSAFRSRRTPLPEAVANEIVKIFEKKCLMGNGVFAETYVDALPYCPPTVDDDRRYSYESNFKNAVARCRKIGNGSAKSGGC